MKYLFSGDTPPKMPKLGKGTECIKLLLTQTSKDMHEPLVPVLFPILGAHISCSEFYYPDNTWKEMCGMIANLVGDSGCNKGQLTSLAEAICRSFRTHDSLELEKLITWQKEYKGAKGNQKKPVQPETAFLFPPADITNPAFLLNAMACENQGGMTQYLNLQEIEMANRICGGHKQISLMIRNIYDRQRSGALRATAEGVSGNPILRTNITISSTPYATRQFYKNDLFNGTFGRVVFSYKPRTARDGRIPRQGKYTDEFYKKLDVFIARLEATKGRFIIKPLNKLIDNLAEDMAKIADLADDDFLWDISKRALVSAWKAGCVMWVLNNQQWSKAMGEIVEWLVYRDIWSKMKIFADLLAKDGAGSVDSQPNGPKNMLDELTDSFNISQLEAIRESNGKKKEGAKNQVYQWIHREFVTYSAQTGLYTKTEKYLKSVSKNG